MKKDELTDEQKKENLATFGVENIKITEEDIIKAKKDNEKDNEPLEVPTFVSNRYKPK